jgi:hypothetical protein
MTAPATRRSRHSTDPLHVPGRGALTAAGLYLATGSPAATLIGTAAWAALAGWTMWLTQRAQPGQRNNHGPSSKQG